MPESLLFLTELVGLAVFDSKGRKIGRIRDAALVPLIDPIRVDRYLIGGGSYAYLSFRYDQIESIALDGIRLRDENLVPYHADEYMLRMVRDLMDQQIIDAQGRKVVRVTDVTFELHESRELRVLEVDIGLRSMFRRVFQGVLPRKLIRRLQGPIPPHSIRWEFTNILEPDPQRRLRLNITHSLLENMHPADLADIVEELSPEDREALMEQLDSEVAADTLTEVDPEIQASILENLDSETAAGILEEMSPDEAADALAELEEGTTQDILNEMESEPQTELTELLEYEEDTAGGLMNTEYVALSDTATVGDAFQALKENEDVLDSMNTVFLTSEDGKLTGAVPLVRLFGSASDVKLSKLCVENLLKVSSDEQDDDITELFDKYNLLSLPVVDGEGRLEGVITADDVIAILRQR